MGPRPAHGPRLLLSLGQRKVQQCRRWQAVSMPETHEHALFPHSPVCPPNPAPSRPLPGGAPPRGPPPPRITPSAPPPPTHTQTNTHKHTPPHTHTHTNTQTHTTHLSTPGPLSCWPWTAARARAPQRCCGRPPRSSSCTGSTRWMLPALHPPNCMPLTSPRAGDQAPDAHAPQRSTPRSVAV